MYEDLIYHRGLAQDVTLYATSTEASASLYLVATVRPGVEPADLEAAALEHVVRAAAVPLPGSISCGRATASLATHYAELQTLERRADLISELTTYFDDPWRILSEPRPLPVADAGGGAVGAAARWLDPGRRAVVTVVPAEAK